MKRKRFNVSFPQTLEEIKGEIIRKAVKYSKGNKSQAAFLLGIDVKTVRKYTRD